MRYRTTVSPFSYYNRKRKFLLFFMYFSRDECGGYVAVKVSVGGGRNTKAPHRGGGRFGKRIYASVQVHLCGMNNYEWEVIQALRVSSLLQNRRLIFIIKICFRWLPFMNLDLWQVFCFINQKLRQSMVLGFVSS